MERLSVLGTVVVLAWMGTALSAGEKTTGPLDDDFLTKVATCNQAEVEFSKLADKRAGSERVKEFAATLIKDHQMLNDKVAELLKTRKVGVVAGTEKDTRDEVKRLSKLEGQEFDRAFIDRIAADHKKAITMFEEQVKNGKAADITTFAREHLPHLRKHLAKAETHSKSDGK
jgi:putative membrane protein